MDPKNDFRDGFPRVSAENRPQNMPIVEWLTAVTREKKGATPSQVALAWLLAKGPNVVPIPGTRNQDHLNENLGALNVQLTTADCRRSIRLFPGSPSTAGA